MEHPTSGHYAGPERLPVVAVMSRVSVSGNRWVSERWRFDGCAPDPGGTVAGLQSDEVHHDQQTGERRWRWRGLSLDLHRDAAEDYWFNLSGDAPCVYLVARCGETDRPEPVLVTLDHGEAGAYGEADDEVFSAPLPAELYHQVERFVLTHFTPRAHHKRKRKNWKAPSA
ncbi:MAG: DUF3305 domain-containing protein [Pseudomonadota bacterium]